MEITELEGPSKSVNFQFPESPRSGREVIRASGLAKSYGDHTVFRDVDLVIERGERVALVGVNGAGKSTLMRLLNQSEEPTAGTAELGLNVKKAYFSQESAQNLDYSRTIWQEVNNTGSKLLEGAKRNLLGAFLFSGDEIYKPVSVLSGGEKSRLGLLKMLLSESNLLILDEPTNHLDYGTKELFQKALLQYGGTILIVSHDRAFLDDLVSRVVEIRDGKLYDYPGNYSWFIEKRAGRDAPAPAAKTDPAENLPPNCAPAPRRAARRRGRRNSGAPRPKNATASTARKGFVERLAACEKRSRTSRRAKRRSTACSVRRRCLRTPSVSRA